MNEKKGFMLVGLIWVLLLAIPQILTQPFYLHLMILVFLYAMLAGSWNILGGYAGQVSLGHAVFFGIGAYSSTMGLMEFGLSPWLGMLAGGFIAAAGIWRWPWLASGFWSLPGFAAMTQRCWSGAWCGEESPMARLRRS